MKGPAALALEATQRIRQSYGFRGLHNNERSALDRDLARIESALTGDPYAFPYASAMATPGDLANDLAGFSGGGGSGGAPAAAAPPPPAPAPAPAPSGPLATIGQRTAETLEAVNFPAFVAGLVTGTFQAIVDATTQQVRDYAELVASISRSVDDFSRDNVSAPQIRDWFVSRFPNDLAISFPAAGKPGDPTLVPKPGSEGTSPPWLEEYGLGGQELTAELTEGQLVEAGRNHVGEQRLQSLATLVLMGINRIVINDGEIKAKLQFHAQAQEKTTAEMNTMALQQGGGISGRSIGSQGASMMVSTMKANAQADASIKTDLVGEVRVSFRSETFSLDRFADSAAIQLINRHAKWQGNTAAPAAPGAPGAPAAPAAAPAPPPPAAEGRNK